MKKDCKTVLPLENKETVTVKKADKDKLLAAMPNIKLTCSHEESSTGFGDGSIIYDLNNPHAEATLSSNGKVVRYYLISSTTGTPTTIDGKQVFYTEKFMKVKETTIEGDVENQGNGLYRFGKHGSHTTTSKAKFEYIDTNAEGTTDGSPVVVDLHIFLENINAGFVSNADHFGERWQFHIEGGSMASGQLAPMKLDPANEGQLLSHTQSQSTITGTDLNIDTSGSFTSYVGTNPNLIFNANGKGSGVVVTYSRTGVGTSQYDQFGEVNVITALQPQETSSKECTEWTYEKYTQKMNINEIVKTCSSCGYGDPEHVANAIREVIVMTDGKSYRPWLLDTNEFPRFKPYMTFSNDTETVDGKEEFPFIWEKQERRDCANLDLYLRVCTDCSTCAPCEKRNPRIPEIGDTFNFKEIKRVANSPCVQKDKYDSCGNDISPKDCWHVETRRRFGVEFCGTKKTTWKDCILCKRKLEQAINSAAMQTVDCGKIITKSYPVPFEQKDTAESYLENLFKTETGISTAYVTINTTPTSTTTPGSIVRQRTKKMLPSNLAENKALEFLKIENPTLGNDDLEGYTNTQIHIATPTGAPTGTAGEDDKVLTSVDLTKTGSTLKTVSHSTSFNGDGFHNSSAIRSDDNTRNTKDTPNLVRFTQTGKFSLILPIKYAMVNGTTLVAPSGWQIQTHALSDNSLVYYLKKDVVKTFVRIYKSDSKLTAQPVERDDVSAHRYFRTTVIAAGARAEKITAKINAEKDIADFGEHFDLRQETQEADFELPANSWFTTWEGNKDSTLEKEDTVIVETSPGATITENAVYGIPNSTTPSTFEEPVFDTYIYLKEKRSADTVTHTDGQGTVTGRTSEKCNVLIKHLSELRVNQMAGCDLTVITKWGDKTLVQVINETKVNIDKKQEKTASLAYFDNIKLETIKRVI